MRIDYEDLQLYTQIIHLSFDELIKDYHINVFYSDEDGGYIADIPDLKYCSASQLSSGHILNRRLTIEEIR